MIMWLAGLIGLEMLENGISGQRVPRLNRYPVQEDFARGRIVVDLGKKMRECGIPGGANPRNRLCCWVNTAMAEESSTGPAATDTAAAPHRTGGDWEPAYLARSAIR